jgi:hypothetical protein
MNTGLGQVYIWHRWELQPLQYLEDEDRDGPFFAIQPLDAAGSLRRFYEKGSLLVWDIIYLDLGKGL